MATQGQGSECKCHLAWHPEASVPSSGFICSGDSQNGWRDLGPAHAREASVGKVKGIAAADGVMLHSTGWEVSLEHITPSCHKGFTS